MSGTATHFCCTVLKQQHRTTEVLNRRAARTPGGLHKVVGYIFCLSVYHTPA